MRGTQGRQARVRRGRGLALAGAFALVATAAAAATQWPPFGAPSDGSQLGPSLEDYIEHVGPPARLVPPGAFTIDGIRMSCGRRPTVVNPEFESWGGAYPGFLIWNPRMTESLSTTVKLYVYAHECGHQFVGRDELAADCFAVQRGRRYGWLDDAGLDEVCAFIKRLKPTPQHPPGERRCVHMRRCYGEAIRHTGDAGR